MNKTDNSVQSTYLKMIKPLIESTEEIGITDDQIVEDILALDELSKKTLGSYIDNAEGQKSDLAGETDAESKRIKRNRIKGIARANKKLNTEQIEAILVELEDDAIIEDILALDELSKATLGSYVKKASLSAASHGVNHGSTGSERSGKKLIQRVRGITKATDKLTKEQVEVIESVLDELEEISTATKTKDSLKSIQESYKRMFVK